MLGHRFEPLMAMRFLHGTVGGMLVGIGFVVLPLVPTYGTSMLFIALILFSLVTLAMVPCELQISGAGRARKRPACNLTQSLRCSQRPNLAPAATFARSPFG